MLNNLRNSGAAQKGPACSPRGEAGRQAGLAPLLLILLAALGIIIFLLITSTVPFKDRLFSLLFPKTPSQAQKAESVPDEILVKFKPGVSDQAKGNALKRYNIEIQETIPGIEVAVLKVPEQAKDKLIEALNKNPNIEYAEANHIVEAQLNPNDYYYPNQWILPKISASTGWDISTGSSQAVIAILDTGIDLNHEDLKGKYLDSPTQDDNGHGTLVSGVAVADTNNQKGIAGICWFCPTLVVKVLGSTGSGSDSEVARGIVYAADQGAKIINLSFGSSAYSSSMANAVNYAWGKGLVLVAASGNTPSPPIIMYPAAYDNVIAVGGITSADGRVGDSNYGPWLDVVAPGYNVLTTLNGNGYGPQSGTSVASPHVAGLAGLILSANPGISNQQVFDIITQTADDLGPSGKDDEYGWGRINITNALSKAINTTPPPPDTAPPAVSITQPSGGTVSGVIEVKAEASDNIGVVQVNFMAGHISIVDATAPYAALIDTTQLKSGCCTSIFAYAFDAAGNSIRTYISVSPDNSTSSDTTPPAVSITQPSDGSTMSGNVTISASASDNAGIASVTFFVDGIFSGEDTTSPYSMVWDTTKEGNGSHTIQTKAVDTSGNVGQSSIITVNVNNPTPTTTTTPPPASTPTPNPILPDTTPPTVSITNPSDGAIIQRASQIQIQADAQDNVSVSKVEFYINTTLRCVVAASPYTCTWKVPGKRGASYTIKASAFDPSDNTSSVIIKVTAN